MTKLKKYNTIDDWNSTQGSLKYPSVGLIGKKVFYKDSTAADVAYYDGSIKTIPLAYYKEELGPAIGVVVIPKGVIGDARIISLKGVGAQGSRLDYEQKWVWYDQLWDVDNIYNHTYIPITDNMGLDANSTGSSGYLPTDKNSGTISFVDPKSCYSYNSSMIPSPYLVNDSNPEYFVGAFSVTDGWTILGVGSSTAFVARLYKDGITNKSWYLPTLGELGFIPPRIYGINKTLKALGGVPLSYDDIYYSCTEYNYTYAWGVNLSSGFVGQYTKTNAHYVRPFMVIYN